MRQYIRGKTGRIIGFIYQQDNKLWRGYSYIIGIGYGPFASQCGALNYVVYSQEKG